MINKNKFMPPKICLVLTGSTLEEDLSIINWYRQTSNAPQMLELRVDMLNHEEIFEVHKFPSCVDLPVILTIRRERDGGEFKGGEYARALTFSRCINASLEGKKSFDYIDLEDDFCVNELEEACQILGIKIIRSHHSIDEPIKNYGEVIEKIKKQKHDIIKIASYSTSLADTQKLFEASEKLKNEEHILVAMGKYGIVSRILASHLDSKWVYSFSFDEIERRGMQDEAVEPENLNSHYNFHKIRKKNFLYGIIGSSVNNAGSLAEHNLYFRKNNLACSYIPLSAKNIEEAIEMARYLGLKGLSVTAPFKIQAMQYASEIDESAKIVGSCNTLTFFGECFFARAVAYNTDIVGFEMSLKAFMKEKLTSSLHASILGAGGASKAVCYVLHKLGLKNVVIFNRTHAKAESLALQYNFSSCMLDGSATELLREHSQLIINTTSCGGLEYRDVDPLPFYKFKGDERVFDINYNPSPYSHTKSPLVEKAKNHGCMVEDGWLMFKYQAAQQQKIFYKHLLK